MMYFDSAATTPPDPEVLKTFDAVNRDFWANPGSLYRPGLRAEGLLEQARAQVLSLLGAAGGGYRCIFTSGATESNNTAIRGVAQLCANRGRHLISSAVEHPSVLRVFQALEAEGWEITLLPVDGNGAVEPAPLEAALRPETVLVSLMHVNNEVGAINPLPILGKIIREGSSALFHVDAAQSVGKMEIGLRDGHIDLLSFSAHKFFGLKGSGALILPEGLELPPLLHGGGQEFGLRSGTADPARAATLARALRLAVEGSAAAGERVRNFRRQIIGAMEAVEQTRLNGAAEGVSPYIINFSVAGVNPETVLQALSEREIYISTVSACSARRTEESHVVRALSGSAERARSSIRISLSARTTQPEVDALCAALPEVIGQLRFKR